MGNGNKSGENGRRNREDGDGDGGKEGDWNLEEYEKDDMGEESDAEDEWDLDKYEGKEKNREGGEGDRDVDREGDDDKERGGRFDDVEIPEERSKSRKLKMIALLILLAAVGSASVGAVFVFDGGSGGGGEGGVEANPSTEGGTDVDEQGVDQYGSEGDHRNVDTENSGTEASQTTDEEGGTDTRRENWGDAELDGEPEIESLPFTAGESGGEQLVRLRNTGDPVETSMIEIDVSIPEYDSSATVTGLPTSKLNHGQNVVGDNMLDLSYGGVDGATEEPVWNDNVLVLRIKHSNDGESMRPGDVVDIEVRHASGQVLYSGQITAD